ncbi:MAG: class I SAM-dependent methyltransferase [Oscillospiraceae bacterium]|nr:class I SAM-dependent methyltransferase [Oscillospiraceae bacterium]
MERTEMINSFYDGYYEDTRLERSRHGQLEYRTTMHYIQKVMPTSGTVLEIGAGTGRYSVSLAKMGRRVTALELAERNLELLRQNAQGIGNLTALQGDAVDLSRFADDSFDVTLLFGPMYHLYDEQERDAALREAVRVTRPGGHILTAFLSVHAILFDNYLRGNLKDGLSENFDADYRVLHFQNQLFTGYDIPELEALYCGLPVTPVTLAATDGILELAGGRADFAMSDEEFEAYTAYHLHFCEQRELLGCSSHLLHICRKNTVL